MNMIDLPLFPLNTVLFPYTPLHLHIFEERYKKMIAYCRAAGSPFGVVLIQRGVEALGPSAEPYPIGCTAEIAQLQPLSQGRMNLVVVGQNRFRIRTLNHDQPYLMGEVDFLPIRSGSQEELAQADHSLRPWLERYLRTLNSSENPETVIQQLPTDPLALADVAAMVLQMPPRKTGFWRLTMPVSF
jgi:Lon protease-like protein